MKSVRYLGARVSCIAVLWALSGCSAVGDSVVDLAEQINASLDTASISITVGDTVYVSFPFKSEWNHQTRVRPDGSAAFQLIDDVAVAGLTVGDLDARLTGLYREARNGQEEIELTVSVPSAGGGAGAGAPASSGAGASGLGANRVAYVVGEVQNPGPIGLAGRPTTLIEAIAAVGGHLKPTANLRNVVLVRRLAASNEMRSWRLDADIYSWGDMPPIFLQPRDVVFVPNTAIDDVDIWIDQYVRQILPFPYLVRPL